MTGPLVLGTAGHVDHGKTALVLALTGHDTDRLPEEKSRGISITLGFAPLALSGGRVVSLVDVPGHERFVRHMVAGAGGVDGYLLCVAADDGVMPQTLEHLSVLRLLGVREGVVAITKADLADPAAASTAVRELMGDGPEIVPVSATTGDGVPEVRAALEQLCQRITRRTAAGPARLFVDRSFSVPGAGTVATGSLWGSGMGSGDDVTIIPGGATGRVRGIEVHDLGVAVAAGGRVALNLAGVERASVPRGSVVVRTDDRWTPSALVDVAIDWLPDAGGALRTRRRLQTFLGTAEVPATCVLLDADELAPGGRGYAQLRLDAPVVATAGDRIVLRSAERRTVGGATVIDPAPRRHGKGSGAGRRLAIIERGDPVELLALRLEDAGPAGLAIDDAQSAAIVAAGGEILVPGHAVAVVERDRARRRIVAAASAQPITESAAAVASELPAAMAAVLIGRLVDEGAIERGGGLVGRPGMTVRDPRLDDVATELELAGLRPPPVAELAAAVGMSDRQIAAALGRLRDEGAIVAAGDLWFEAANAEAARAAAVKALSSGPKTIAELRDLWGVGRRQALALAAWLDGTGVTRRVGDTRVLRRGSIVDGE